MPIKKSSQIGVNKNIVHTVDFIKNCNNLKFTTLVGTQHQSSTTQGLEQVSIIYYTRLFTPKVATKLPSTTLMDY